MPEDPYDALVADLVALRHVVPERPADPGLTRAVMARVAGKPTPATRRAGLLGRAADAVRPARRRVALALVTILVAVLAAPPVRATVADWFGFAGVLVQPGRSGAPTAPPPPTATAGDVSRAAEQVAFTPRLPALLGRPVGVTVSADRRVLSATWSDPDAGTIRLDQFDGTLDFAMAKSSPRVHFAEVDGVGALWFEEPHRVVVIEPNGTRRAESARLAGHTLIWPDGPVTLRLEGDLTLARAVAIAASAEPVR